MINANMLRGKIAEAGMTQKQVAEELGMTQKTFGIKMKTGKFGLDEAQHMISMLKIDKPDLIFFANEVACEVTKGA